MPIETFTAQVESIKNLTYDVRQLDMRLREPKTITFKPGQFVSFEVPHPQTGHVVTRPYSIASQPSRSDVPIVMRPQAKRFALDAGVLNCRATRVNTWSRGRPVSQRLDNSGRSRLAPALASGVELTSRHGVTQFQ